MQISVITLAVENPPQAALFYQRSLGLSPKQKGDVIYLPLDNIALALYPPDKLGAYLGKSLDSCATPPITLSINLPSETAVIEHCQRLCEHGAQVTREAGAVSWGGFIAGVQDPHGVLWELVFNPSFVETPFSQV